MVVFPNCKINIGLNITEKRADGFHNIESIFYPIPWHDALEIVPASKTQLHTSGITIDCSMEKNLVYKAYQLLQKDFTQIAIGVSPIDIYLHKAIPMGAGLGGGSSNAAYMLKLCNDYFKLNLASKQLEDYARELGSDCAFFIQNKAVFAFDKGDDFEPIKMPNLSNYKILIVYPDIHIDTTKAYKNITPQSPNTSLKDLIKKPISDWKHTIQNDFEQVIFKQHPEIENIKNTLYNEGALYASMSGSGSAVYGIFEKEKMTTFKQFDNYLIYANDFPNEFNFK